MCFNLKSIFGKKSDERKTEIHLSGELEFDTHADFYCTNLINSIILFSFNTDELEKLAGPSFNPMPELETEIDYAFVPVCFETIFRNKLIDFSNKGELLEFKTKVDIVPKEIWDWEFIKATKNWS